MRDKNKISVLLVDDEPHILSVLESRIVHIIEDFGYSLTVDTAENAGKGLTLFEAWKYDLVISDLRMPGDSGVFLAENITHLRCGLFLPLRKFRHPNEV